MDHTILEDCSFCGEKKEVKETEPAPEDIPLTDGSVIEKGDPFPTELSCPNNCKDKSQQTECVVCGDLTTATLVEVPPTCSDRCELLVGMAEETTMREADGDPTILDTEHIQLDRTTTPKRGGIQCSECSRDAFVAESMDGVTVGFCRRHYKELIEEYANFEPRN